MSPPAACLRVRTPCTVDKHTNTQTKRSSMEVCSCVHLKCLRISPGCTKPYGTRGGVKETCLFPPKIIMYNPKTQFNILRHLSWMQEQTSWSERPCRRREGSSYTACKMWPRGRVSVWHGCRPCLRGLVVSRPDDREAYEVTHASTPAPAASASSPAPVSAPVSGTECEACPSACVLALPFAPFDVKARREVAEQRCAIEAAARLAVGRGELEAVPRARERCRGQRAAGQRGL